MTEPVFVDCIRNGIVIATYEFGAVGSNASPPSFNQKQLEDEAFMIEEIVNDAAYDPLDVDIHSEEFTNLPLEVQVYFHFS